MSVRRWSLFTLVVAASLVPYAVAAANLALPPLGAAAAPSSLRHRSQLRSLTGQKLLRPPSFRRRALRPSAFSPANDAAGSSTSNVTDISAFGNLAAGGGNLAASPSDSAIESVDGTPTTATGVSSSVQTTSASPTATTSPSSQPVDNAVSVSSSAPASSAPSTPAVATTTDSTTNVAPVTSSDPASSDAQTTAATAATAATSATSAADPTSASSVASSAAGVLLTQTSSGGTSAPAASDPASASALSGGGVATASSGGGVATVSSGGGVATVSSAVAQSAASSGKKGAASALASGSALNASESQAPSGGSGGKTSKLLVPIIGGSVAGGAALLFLVWYLLTSRLRKRKDTYRDLEVNFNPQPDSNRFTAWFSSSGGSSTDSGNTHSHLDRIREADEVSFAGRSQGLGRADSSRSRVLPGVAQSSYAGSEYGGEGRGVPLGGNDGAMVAAYPSSSGAVPYGGRALDAPEPAYGGSGGGGSRYL